MTATWPTVPLGEVVDHRKEFIIIDDLQNYRRPRVQLHAQGILLRDDVPGAMIKTKKQQVARAGEFLVAEIDAKVGGFGIVPTDLDGSIVSSHYFLFQHRPERLDERYLGWFIKTPAFRQQVAAQGSTNYAAIRPADVLGYEIPLPPLHEQLRIVARIEDLAAKVAQTKGLRKNAVQETTALVASYAEAVLSHAHWKKTRLEDACLIITDGTHQTPRYVEEGATFLSAQNVKPFRFLPEIHRKVSWEDFAGYTARNKPRQGDVLLTRVGAGIGEAAVIDQDIDFAIYVSIALIRPDPSLLSSEFLVHWLNSPIGRGHSRSQTLGRGHSQGNLNLNLLRGFPIPLPPIDEQRRVVAQLNALQVKIDAVKRLQTETAAELDAMLPAILDTAFKGEL
jgi:type I restriction enzyme, S subunit